VLQAYGLKYALEGLGCSVTFIRDCSVKGSSMKDRSIKDNREPNGAAPENDRRDPNEAVPENDRRNPNGAAPKNDWRDPDEAVPENNGKDRYLKVLEALRKRQQVLRSSANAVSAFSERHFRTEKWDGQNDINQSYDFFIAGSDQIWNVEITGLDPFWFLDFAQPEKRLTYAVSFGKDCLPESCLSWYREMLAGFTAFSVREETGRRIIHELTGKDAVVCPDPVLLPERRVWEELMQTADQADPSVVLYMTEFDAGLYQYAKADAAAKKLPLAILSPVKLPFTEETTICTPEAWLGYIANAAVVYTNSYHALIFSHIFHKDLRIRLLTKMRSRNDRIFAFIESMGEALVEDETRPGLFLLEDAGGEGYGVRPHGECTDSRLNTLRNFGIDYLRNAL